MENGVKLLLLRSFLPRIYIKTRILNVHSYFFFHSQLHFTCSCMGNSPPKIKSPGLWRILLLLSPARRPEGSMSPPSRSPPSRSTPSRSPPSRSPPSRSPPSRSPPGRSPPGRSPPSRSLPHCLGTGLDIKIYIYIFFFFKCH